MGIQHNVSARPPMDIYPGSHRRMKLSINGYQMIFSKTFPSMTNDLPHLWSVLIAQLKAWISKASYNIPLNCQWSIAFAVAACTSAKLLFFQTQFCIITAYHTVGVINFKNLCAHHQEEVLRILKHPQLAKFEWFWAKLWPFQKSIDLR